MGRFREKMLDWKKRLSDRHMYSVVVVLIAIVAVWGIYQYRHAADLRQELDNQYNRAFFDMVGHVQNVEVLLNKGLICNSPELTIETLKNAWHQANMAQTNLGQIPIAQGVLANTSRFLCQVGDFAQTMDRQNVNGQRINDEQYRTLEKLHEFSVSLRDGLNNLQANISEGRIKWNELAKEGPDTFQEQSENLAAQLINGINNNFEEFPTLIYDGPFSDHMLNVEPKGLTGNEITVEEAQQKLTRFFGEDKVASIEHTGDIQNNTIPAYNFRVQFKDRPETDFATADMSKKGGHVLCVLYNREIGQETIDMDKVIDIAGEFLQTRGYPNMKDTYYIKENGFATVNFAYEQNGVVVYSDLVKIKIALDNGEMVGFESRGFYMNHTERQIPAPVLTEEEARGKVLERADIQSVGLVIIPTNYGTEVFCYEVIGRVNDKDFLVYINAQTGKEEQVLIIINTENGTLTM